MLGCAVARMPIMEDIRPSKSACRSLFGPVDHDELKETLRIEKENINQIECDKWNFDFRRGRPLPGRFAWQLVDSGERVPRAYEMLQISKRKRDSDDTPETGDTQDTDSNNTAKVARVGLESSEATSSHHSSSPVLEDPSTPEPTESQPEPAESEPVPNTRQSKMTELFSQKKRRSSSSDKQH